MKLVEKKKDLNGSLLGFSGQETKLRMKVVFLGVLIRVTQCGHQG